MCKCENDLNSSDLWFRDLLYKLFGWFSGALLIVSGWLLTRNEIVNLGNSSGKGFLFGSGVCLSVWFIAVLWCYKNCPPHVTVLRPLAFWIYMFCNVACFVVLVLFAIDVC